MDGIIIINKPAGITSNGVIKQVKRVSGQSKIGHLGTLDPLAKGVLPLFLGKMTKLVSFFNQNDKGYQVQVKLGWSSTTLDAEGELTQHPLPPLTPEQVTSTLLGFVGEMDQVPPMYSAVKLGGQKLYELARKGIEVERQPRRITIHWIKNIQVQLPLVEFEVYCSKGTYIRSLAQDLGKALGTQAYMSDLLRTTCGEIFPLARAISLDQIINLDKSGLNRLMIDPQELLPDWPVVLLGEEHERQRLEHGQSLQLLPDRVHFPLGSASFTHAMVKDQNGHILAVGNLEFSQDSIITFHPTKVLVG